MVTFKKLQEIRSQFKRIPGFKSCMDFDIALEIGYRQRKGSPLTLKQLLLLNIAPAATVRRCLIRMINEGIVVKTTAANDHRFSHYLLNEPAMTHLEGCLKNIKLILGSEALASDYD